MVLFNWKEIEINDTTSTLKSELSLNHRLNLEGLESESSPIRLRTPNHLKTQQFLFFKGFDRLRPQWEEAGCHQLPLGPCPQENEDEEYAGNYAKANIHPKMLSHFSLQENIFIKNVQIREWKSQVVKVSDRPNLFLNSLRLSEV